MWLALVLAGLLLWSGLAPLYPPHREQSLDLGHSDGLVPSEIRMTQGVQDVLVLRNSGRRAEVFGQLRILPGQVIRLPFEQVGTTSFACSCAFRGELAVRVVAPPDPGWARLRWRFDGLIDSMRSLRAVAPLTS